MIGDFMTLFPKPDKTGASCALLDLRFQERRRFARWESLAEGNSRDGTCGSNGPTG